MRLFRKPAAAFAACLLSAVLCLPANADAKPETALKAYTIMLTHPTIKDEDASWFTFKKPVDLNNDGIPELFLAKQGSAVICVEPDGTERLRIGEAGTIQVVSSQAAVYTKTIQERETGRWVVDFALIDLTTGIGRRSFEKTYTSASVLMTHNASGFAQLQGYFLANYRDLDGNLCGDLLDAAGNIVIENVWNWDSEYRPGDAFCTEGGYRRLDGSWLYRFE